MNIKQVLDNMALPIILVALVLTAQCIKPTEPKVAWHTYSVEYKELMQGYAASDNCDGLFSAIVIADIGTTYGGKNNYVLTDYLNYHIDRIGC